MSRGLYEMLRLSREEVGQLRHENERLKAINDFLIGQFQMFNPDMGGNHSYRFRNAGWPMTHLRGPNIEAAIENAMEEVSRDAEIEKAKGKQ
jgi:hypothetical protein